MLSLVFDRDNWSPFVDNSFLADKIHLPLRSVIFWWEYWSLMIAINNPWTRLLIIGCFHLRSWHWSRHWTESTCPWLLDQIWTSCHLVNRKCVAWLKSSHTNECKLDRWDFQQKSKSWRRHNIFVVENWTVPIDYLWTHIELFHLEDVLLLLQFNFISPVQTRLFKYKNLCSVLHVVYQTHIIHFVYYWPVLCCVLCNTDCVF